MHSILHLLLSHRARFYEFLPHVTNPWPHSPSRNKAWTLPTHSLTSYQPSRTLGGIFATLEQQVWVSVWSSRQTSMPQIPAPAQTFIAALLVTLSWVIGSLWPVTQWTQKGTISSFCVGTNFVISGCSLGFEIVAVEHCCDGKNGPY